MSKPTLSVALCTCNGEKYISMQLNSILSQLLPVDEIIISDDMSTDRTIDIIRDIARTATIPIKVLENKTASRYGVCANFEKAIAATTGEIIFFSDQDDCWMTNKRL